jgi:hypothetical protein
MKMRLPEPAHRQVPLSRRLSPQQRTLFTLGPASRETIFTNFKACSSNCSPVIPPPLPPCASSRFLVMTSRYGASQSHSFTHWEGSSGRVTNPAQRLPPYNTQRSQETNIHTSGGIRTHDSSMRAAADPRFIRPGHLDRRCPVIFSCRWTEHRIALRVNRKLRVHGFQMRSRLLSASISLFKYSERNLRYGVQVNCSDEEFSLLRN